MRNFYYILISIALLGSSSFFASCDDEVSYADQKEKERNAINAFIHRSPLHLVDGQGEDLLDIPQINVISLEEFEDKGCVTDVDNNEFVLFKNNGIYMQIVRPGVGEKIKSGESKRIICRYWEYNILGDSLQTRDDVLYWATNPEILDVTNNSGTIKASFNKDVNGGGAMYLTYKSEKVPNGWLAPLNYIKVGRQTMEGEGIAKVRIIVPHTEGHDDAKSNVYPCMYEITYQEMRD